MATTNLLFVKPKPPAPEKREEEVKKCLTCNITFADSASQKIHFKSEWHLYNIKRKNSQLPPISHDEYLSIKSQLQEMLSSKKEKNRKKISTGNSKRSDLTASPEATPVKTVELYQRSTIFNPNKCLFSEVVSKTISDNVKYMEKHYTFYLPEKEYITDLEGLLRYLHNKIYESKMCLYCDKQFSDHYATLHHMVDKQHHKVHDDRFEDISPFYDFIDSYVNLIVDSRGGSSKSCSSKSCSSTCCDLTPCSHKTDEADDEWEDLFSTTTSPTRIEDLLSSYGLKKAYIMDNGNLSLPNGKEAVHRELSYVYKQNLVVQSPLAMRRKQDNFKFKKKSEKRQIIMCQKQEQYRTGKRDLSVALKGNKLFVPVRQDICFG